MMDRYGKAVVEERVKPRHLAEVARYLRMEYGPGTGPGYLLAESADGSRRKAQGRTSTLARVGAALAAAFAALMPGQRASEKGAEPTR